MILVSHPTGNANTRSALAAFEEAGLLLEFWTCVAWDDAAPGARLFPTALRRRLGRRQFPEVPGRKIRTDPWRELARQIAPRLGFQEWTAHESGWCSVDAVYGHLDARVARRLCRQPRPAAVYAAEDGAEATFRTAAELGIGRIYELPIGYWRAARNVYEEEAAAVPEWAGTLTGLLDSAEKLERKDSELRNATQVVVASRFTRDTLALAPGEVPPVSVIPYGAPPPIDGARLRTRHGGPVRVLFAGSLGQRKGLSYLLEAVESLGAAVELTLLGAKTAEGCEPLERAVRRHRWIPSVAHQAVLDEMERHDVLVFPSLFEGFGLVILEAMSRGLPVIATPHTAAPDVVREGVDGFIVPVRSSEAIAAALERLVADPELLSAMKHAALEGAARFPWSAHREALAELAKGIVLP